MNWIRTTLMSRAFMQGYSFQPYFGHVTWMDWCGGGPLDNEAAAGEQK